jgi:hypothetical protein
MKEKSRTTEQSKNCLFTKQRRGDWRLETGDEDGKDDKEVEEVEEDGNQKGTKKLGNGELTSH